ncbi:helix-turn-helix domain-containing protein [Aliarcobacter cryaerophilus]|uniref:helix-turn-helix domain-containing protein n=1 Tax=Aliarcobacter cryaerophilus TaxID=28198 RepID=UPI001C63DAD2|nr:AraC family transcriptional regulator [Aliarcobacter cryaerophilus]
MLQLKTIGRVETISILDLELFDLDVKIDTGAYSNSLHCDDIFVDEDNFALVRKLTEIIFVQALRIHMYKSNKNAGFFKLIENPQLSKTFEAIHHSLDKKWGLDDLAGIAGMSRTNYSVKFKELSGMTPLDYLTYCRLEKAKQLLKESGKSVPEVSEAIGYPAHEHFQKLFKKKIGKTPSAYRKENSEKV